MMNWNWSNSNSACNIRCGSCGFIRGSRNCGCGCECDDNCGFGCDERCGCGRRMRNFGTRGTAWTSERCCRCGRMRCWDRNCDCDRDCDCNRDRDCDCDCM